MSGAFRQPRQRVNVSDLSVIPAKRSASRNPGCFGGNLLNSLKTVWIPAPTYYPPE
jgi:hypothetical protein